MQWKRGFKGAWIALLALGLDQLTKAMVRRLPGGQVLIPGILRCRPVRNAGMAFSMLSGHTWLLTGLTALILLALALWLILRPDEPPLMRTGFWMILGGGLGNLIDRLLYGTVTDFLSLEFVRFAIFNVADVFVCIGAGLAALGLLLSETRGEVKRHGPV